MAMLICLSILILNCCVTQPILCFSLNGRWHFILAAMRAWIVLPCLLEESMFDTVSSKANHGLISHGFHIKSFWSLSVWKWSSAAECKDGFGSVWVRPVGEGCGIGISVWLGSGEHKWYAPCLCVWILDKNRWGFSTSPIRLRMRLDWQWRDATDQQFIAFILMLLC